MATFLTTSRMNPALAARVERSARGGRAARSGKTRALVAVARVSVVLALVVVVWVVVSAREQGRDEVETARATLLDDVERQAADVAGGDRDVVTRAERWLGWLASADPPPDAIAEELRPPGALAAALRRPLVYMRGPIESFANYEGVAAAAAASKKDALLLCLLDPPASRKEADVLDRVHVAYGARAATEERTAHAHRLADAIVGLPFLHPSWADRVREAETRAQIARLRLAFDRAPLEGAKAATKAELLLLAIDEPGDPRDRTELDGARPHHLRLALVDLPGDRVLMLRRIHMDPSWISEERRPLYASGLDACKTALDVHEQVREEGT